MEKLSAINGLRGLAVLGVIWHHLFYSSLTPPGALAVELAGITFLPLTLLSNGWLGVNLFFILSGFVLYFPFASARREMSGWRDCLTFYARRAKRLLPLFWFSLAAFVLIDYHFYGRIYSPTELALYFSAAFSFTDSSFMPSVNWVLWSLGLEIWFSALFPLLVVLSCRYGPTRVLIVSLALSLAIRIYAIQWAEIGYLNPMKDSLFGRLDDFVVGMWLCHAFLNPPRTRISSLALFGFGLAGVLVVCSFWDLLVMGKIDPIALPFLNNLFQLGAAGIIYSMLMAGRSYALDWISLAGLQALGLMTYSLYIWHGKILRIMSDVLSMNASTDLAVTMVYLMALLIVSILSYRFIEFGHVKDTKSLFRTSN